MNLLVHSSLISVFLLFGTGCGRTAGPPASSPQHEAWEILDSREMTPGTEAQLERSILAIRDLGSRLLQALSEGLDTEGAGGGIEICREKAPEIATEVSQRYQLKIGRTSSKLRNPKNQAPEWARSVIDEGSGAAQYFCGPGGELGVLAPIRLKSRCLMCHGPAEDIDESMNTALAEYYPEDQATGFSEGDLRGWFWVEVPPTSGIPETQKSPAE